MEKLTICNTATPWKEYVIGSPGLEEGFKVSGFCLVSDNHVIIRLERFVDNQRESISVNICGIPFIYERNN